MRLRSVVLVLCVTLGAPPLIAQGPHFRLDARGTSVRVQSLAPTGILSELRGTAFGGDGAWLLGRVALEIGYWQGHLTPRAAGGGPPPRSITEGVALLGIHPVPSVLIGGGVQARSYRTPAGVERWVFWQVRARTEQMLVDPAIRVHLELWRAIKADVNAQQPFDRGQGGEVGFTVLAPRSLLWGRVAYSIDDAKLGAGARRETVDALTITIGIGRR